MTSNISDRSREAAQRDIAVAALRWIQDGPHDYDPAMGANAMMAAAANALAKIAEIEKTAPKPRRDT